MKIIYTWEAETLDGPLHLAEPGGAGERQRTVCGVTFPLTPAGAVMAQRAPREEECCAACWKQLAALKAEQEEA